MPYRTGTARVSPFLLSPSKNRSAWEHRTSGPSQARGVNPSVHSGSAEGCLVQQAPGVCPEAVT